MVINGILAWLDHLAGQGVGVGTEVVLVVQFPVIQVNVNIADVLDLDELVIHKLE